MPSQGPNTTASWISDGSGFATWLNPTDAQSSDDVRAEVTIVDLDNYSDGLNGSSWGFTIPAGATVDGIELKFEVSGSGSPLIDNGVFLFKAGPVFSSNRAIFTDMPASDTVRTYGSPTDKWGYSSISAAEVNDSGFGGLIGVLNVTGFSGTAFVDQGTMTVYYTEAADSPWGGRQFEQSRAVAFRARKTRLLAKVRRAVWSGADVVEFEVPISGDLFVNAARRLDLRHRAGRPRVVAWQDVLEAAPEVLDTVEQLVHAMRRAQLRHGRSVRAVLRVVSMDGGHGEGPFVVELPTLKALGEFTKREIWGQTGLRPGEPPPWRRRR